MAEQTVELEPGESKQVSFEAVPNAAKIYQVSVDGLSGSFEAVEEPVAKGFSFGTLTGSSTVCPAATSYRIPILSCLITNPHEQPVTQKIALMIADYSHTYKVWIDWGGSVSQHAERVDAICPNMHRCIDNPFSLTLNPGESYAFDYQGWCYYGGYPACAPLLFLHHTYYFFLMDESGQRSNDLEILIP